MNIVYNGQQKKHEFRDVATGDVFLFDGCPYMKIQQFKSSDGIRYNATTLQDGLLIWFKDSDNVICMDADLVIK